MKKFSGKKKPGQLQCQQNFHGKTEKACHFIKI